MLHKGDVMDGAHKGAGGMIDCSEASVSWEGGSIFQGGGRMRQETRQPLDGKETEEET